MKNLGILMISVLFFLNTNLNCQQSAKKIFNNEIPTISKEINFNNLNCTINMKYQDYEKLTENYIVYDSVYSYSENGKKDNNTWSGAISEDSSLINIDNTDERGKIIPGAPDKIIYNNKICILGKINLDPNYTILAIKVESYEFFVIHLFSYNKDGYLISAIPVGKIEKARLKEDWFTIQSAKINKDNTIWASYLAAGYVELTYSLTQDGRFKVIKTYIEQRKY